MFDSTIDQDQVVRGTLGMAGFERAVELALAKIQNLEVTTRWSSAATIGAPSDPLPSDPDWTRMRAPLLDELHAPATVRAGASLALRRVRALVGLL